MSQSKLLGSQIYFLPRRTINGSYQIQKEGKTFLAAEYHTNTNRNPSSPLALLTNLNKAEFPLPRLLSQSHNHPDPAQHFQEPLFAHPYPSIQNHTHQYFFPNFYHHSSSSIASSTPSA